MVKQTQEPVPTIRILNFLFTGAIPPSLNTWIQAATKQHLKEILSKQMFSNKLRNSTRVETSKSLINNIQFLNTLLDFKDGKWTSDLDLIVPDLRLCM